jgi:hypothetical protein
MTWEEVKRAKERFERELLRKANVVGLAVGRKIVGGRETDELCVVVLVRRKMPEEELSPQDVVPRRLDDVKTDVVETGEIRALGLHLLRPHRKTTARWRPAPPGVSIGHFRVTAGTLGGVVRRGSETYILSNNHVLADSNRGRRGDAVLQPGPVDGGKLPEDSIAVLEDYVPLKWSRRLTRLFAFMSPRNRVDCALARPIREEDLVSEIHLLGGVKGTAEASIDQTLLKSGRTTGLTRGRVTHLEATVTVNYGEGRAAVFEGQILASSMSEGGDSGALVLDQKRRAVGLLFAGSERVTVLNRVEDVLSALRAEI